MCENPAVFWQPHRGGQKRASTAMWSDYPDYPRLHPITPETKGRLPSGTHVVAHPPGCEGARCRRQSGLGGAGAPTLERKNTVPGRIRPPAPSPAPGECRQSQRNIHLTWVCLIFFRAFGCGRPMRHLHATQRPARTGEQRRASLARSPVTQTRAAKQCNR